MTPWSYGTMQNILHDNLGIMQLLLRWAQAPEPRPNADLHGVCGCQQPPLPGNAGQPRGGRCNNDWWAISHFLDQKENSSDSVSTEKCNMQTRPH